MLSENAVLHTYSAICIDKLIGVREQAAAGRAGPLRYDPASLRPSLVQILEPMLRILTSGQGIPQNEYLMRLLVKLFNFLKQGAQELAVPTLQQLGRLLPIVAANPSNPVFIHNLFEAIAGIIRIAVPQQTD